MSQPKPQRARADKQTVARKSAAKPAATSGAGTTRRKTQTRSAKPAPVRPAHAPMAVTSTAKELSKPWQPQMILGLVRSHESMLRAAVALGPALRSVDVGFSPQMARAVQAQESFYDRIAQQFGLLTARETGEQMGSTSNRPDNHAIHARKQGRLVALQRGNRLLFPAWQFDPDGQPLPVVKDLVDLAARHARSERGIVEWVSAPSAFFDGSAPAALLADDPDAILEGAASAWGTAW